MYRLTVTYTDGHSDARVIRTFRSLSRAIDKAMKTPGFARYVVEGA